MKNSIKKLVVFGLALCLVFSVIQPRRSEAAVGGIVCLAGGAGVPVVVTGGVMVLGGVLLGASAGASQNGIGFGAALLGVVGILFGLVVLDGEGSRDIAFSTITEDQAAQLGLSEAQAQAYNSELSEINAIRETIQADVLTQVDKGEDVTAQTVSDSWQSYRGVLSADAFLALEKVSMQLANAATKM